MLPHQRAAALIFFLTLAAALPALAAPWPLKGLVDYAAKGKPLPAPFDGLPGSAGPASLAYVAAASLLVFAAASVVDVALTSMWVRTGRRMVYDLSADLFARVQRRSLSFHARANVGDTMNRVIVDAWSVHTIGTTLLFEPLQALIVGAGVVVLMARVDAPLTALLVGLAPVSATASLMFGRRIRSASRRRRLASSSIFSHVHQTLSGISVVQAFGQERRQRHAFQRFTREAIRAEQTSTVTGSLNRLGTGLLTAIGTGLLTWVGARRVIAGHLSVGDLLVFVSFRATLQTQIAAFTAIYPELQAVRASIDRVMEILEAEPEVHDRPGAPALPAARGHLRLEEVSFGYLPGRPVLSGITLEVRPGETVAIVGPTGAGKSTLVSLAMRFIDPWQGRVSIDGQDLREVSLRSVREQVSLVAQESFLFPISVAENIAYGRPDATQAQIEQAARAAGAHAFIAALPEGYHSVVGERGATLSGGERQRIAIARALLKDAPILILDEPTSAVDAQTEAAVVTALRRRAAGRTTIIIAHRLSTIRHADRIVVLRRGRLVEQGTHRRLLARGGLYARLCAIQAGRTPVARARAQARAGANGSRS